MYANSLEEEKQYTPNYMIPLHSALFAVLLEVCAKARNDLDLSILVDLCRQLVGRHMLKGLVSAVGRNSKFQNIYCIQHKILQLKYMSTPNQEQARHIFRSCE